MKRLKQKGKKYLTVQISVLRNLKKNTIFSHQRYKRNGILNLTFKYLHVFSYILIYISFYIIRAHNQRVEDIYIPHSIVTIIYYKLIRFRFSTMEY